MSFHVGQRVVCVDDQDAYRLATRLFGLFKTWVLASSGRIVRGTVYTVASVWDGVDTITHERTVGVTLSEVEGRFRANRFRPLDEARLDQFRAHLAPAPKSWVSA